MAFQKKPKHANPDTRNTKFKALVEREHKVQVLKAASPFKGFDLEAALQNVIKQHATMQEKVVGLSDEDKAKVKFTVNGATVQAVLKLCNFDAIFGGDEDGSNGEGQSSDTHVEQVEAA